MSRHAECAVPGCPMVIDLERNPSGYCRTHRAKTKQAKPGKQAKAKRGSTWAWRKLRLRVLARDGWRCRYCGAKLRRKPGEPGRPAHVDHVVPVDAGEAELPDPSHLVAACSSCNLRKGAKPLRRVRRTR